MKQLTLIILMMALLGSVAVGQFSSTGKEFYFCYPANAIRYFVTEAIYEPPDFYNGLLIITSSANASGTVSNFDGSFSEPFSVPAGSTISIAIDSSHWIRATETIQSKGLKIEADTLITAYFISFETPGATNDLALLFSTNALGTEYYTMCWQANASTVSGFGSGCGADPSIIAITATEDNTFIIITPAADTDGGHDAGAPFTITLDEFETYQILASSNALLPTIHPDLTGTYIQANKPVYIISGAQVAYVPDSIGAGDYIIESMPPVSAWGKEFNAFPMNERSGFTGGVWSKDVLRILASNDGTEIQLEDDSGVVNVSLDAGEFFTWDGYPGGPRNEGKMLDSETHIISNKPILVGQYMTGSELIDDPISNPGDPAFMLVPPTEQYSKKYIFTVPGEPGTVYDYNYLNIVIPEGAEGSLTLDGSTPELVNDSWTAIPSDSYVANIVEFSVDHFGPHVIEADAPFMVQIYGYDRSFASYATAVGGSVLSSSISDADNLIKSYQPEGKLTRNYPNPFNKHTYIEFILQRQARISLKVYDAAGNIIRRLATNVSYGPGRYIVSWDGRDMNGNQVPPGSYYYKFFMDKYSEMNKMMLIK